MWAHEAVRLIERLHYYWEVEVNSSPPRVRSAVNAFLQAAREEAKEREVMPLGDLATLGVSVKEV